MSESPHCPKCGIQLPADAPAGLCPKCLVLAGFESQPASQPGPTVLTPPNSGFVPPSVDELAGQFPQLEILELLGKGGMGAVYKARQPGLDRLVALKILPPEISHDPAFAERFQREARALAKLSHPHIVAVYDFGQTDSARRGSPDPAVGPTEGLPSASEPQETFGQPGGSVGDRPQRGLCYIVMEFVDGANLRQTIRAGKLAAAEALAIVPQICEALQFAHDEGIVHRDIKPENILIDKRGRVKIADFGLAKLLGQDASDHSLTATHQVMGTLRYMAPEQMQGSREVDHRADIYSLGVVFYELLTGELPMGKFAPPSKKVQVDVRLDEVVLRALEQDPEQRYQHASDVKSDVENVTNSPTVESAFSSAPSRTFLGDTTTWAVLFCLLGLVAVPLTWVSVHYPDEPSVLGRGFHSTEGLVCGGAFLVVLLCVVAIGRDSTLFVWRPLVLCVAGVTAMSVAWHAVYWTQLVPTPVSWWMTYLIDGWHHKGFISTIEIEIGFLLAATSALGLLFVSAVELRSTLQQRRKSHTAEKSWTGPGSLSSSDESAPRHALMISGVVTIISADLTTLLLVAPGSFDAASFQQDSFKITLVVMQGLALLVGIFMVLGSLAARKGATRLARWSAGLGCVPLTPAWLITLPLSIYFLVQTGRKMDEKTGGTPVTQIRFTVSGSMDVVRQAIFHFSSLGYQLIEQQPDVLVFQRGGKWGGLWETDIRKVATRLTVRTMSAADGQSWVSCDWSVRTMGAWITRRDIRQLESEGEGFKSLLGVVVSTERPTDDSPLTPCPNGLVQGPADCLLLAAGIAFVTACGVAIWLLAVPANSSDQFTNSMIRGNLIGMSAGLAIYSMFIGVAGLMLRRRRARLAVLLVAVIVGLFFPAVVALNVVMELRDIPVWPVVIPLWLGVPAALWVVVTLFRADVRRAFDAARAGAQFTGEPRTLQPQGASPVPLPLAKRSTIVERELRGAWNWVAGDSANPNQPPVFPGRLMTLLSLAGCLMLMVPWVDLHIGQDANVTQYWHNAEMPGSFSRTLYGFEQWPGIAAGVALGLLTLLLIMTPGSRPLTWKRAAVMTVIAAYAMVHTFLFKPDLQNSNFTIPIIFHEDARMAGQSGTTSDSRQVVGEPRMERVMSRGSVSLKSIEHQVTYREGYYGSVALTVVLLLLCGIGVRRAAEQPDTKEADADDELGAESASRSRIRRQLKGPAIALMLYGLFLLFPAALCFTNGFDIADGNDGMPASVGFGMIVFSFLLLVLVGLVIRGGWHMLALESHRAALLGNLLGQPVGLWGLFVLSRPEVKAAFASVSRRPAEAFDRPKLVPVFATFNLIGAILLMLVCAMEDSASAAESVPRIWQMWEKVDAVLGFTMAAGMFAASIGLFLWKPWARKLTLGVCVFGLASFVFDAPYLARFAIPDAYSEIQNMLIAEGVDPETRETIAMLIVVTLIGGVMLVGLAWLIGQLVYFTRPRVVAAFESSNENPSRFIEWLFTGAGAVVGVLSVFGPLALLLGIASLLDRGNSTSLPNELPPPPSLGRITSGIGAEFRVPAGQVAVLEIVTRRDGETVPVPPHCGYVIAPTDRRLAATFRWSRAAEQSSNSDFESWDLEIKTAGGGGGFSGGLQLSKDLSKLVGSRSIGMGELTPNEEVIHWPPHDANNLPANGLIGLRVTVTAHGLETSGGSGNAHIDWKKAQRETSTTRRKLPADPSDSIHRAAELGDAVRVKQLLEGGASVNAKDAEGQTPLMKAVAGGHRSLALTLVLLGASLIEQDARGQTAVMIAAEKGDAAFLSNLHELSRISYEKDATVRKERIRAFSGIDRTLLAGRDVDLHLFWHYEAEKLTDESGENALMKAARGGFWDCANELTTQTDTMLARDKLGRTVLMHAVLGGHVEEDAWIKQFEWLTKPPYFGVAGEDNLYVGAMLLFELERSLSVLDKDRKTVLQIAEAHGNERVADILRRHLQTIIVNQTTEIEKGGNTVRDHYRLRALAWQALGEKEKAEADFKKQLPQ